VITLQDGVLKSDARTSEPAQVGRHAAGSQDVVATDVFPCLNHSTRTSEVFTADPYWVGPGITNRL
jgi:hypothetical protein